MENYIIDQLKDVNEKIASEITILLKQHVAEAPDITPQHLKKIIDSQTIFIYIAKNSTNKIVGIVSLICVPKLIGLSKSLIEDLVVDEFNRGKGIGEELMKYSLHKAKSLGITSVSLTSNSRRVAANNLYKKLGFKFYETNYYKYEFE